MEKKKYTLTSAPMVYTPGLLKWAECGYRTSKGKKRETFVNLFADGYKLGRATAVALLSGKITYQVSDENVIFEA